MCTRAQRDSSTAKRGKCRRELLEGDAGLEPGQRRAEAEVHALAEAELVGMPRRMSKRSGSGYSRSSRFAAPISSRMRSPAGTVVPYHSTSRVDRADRYCAGDD